MPPPLPIRYFGPITQQPSWDWVGGDVASHLSATMDIRYFASVDEIADGALVFWIKCPLGKAGAEQIRRKALVLVFFPVDFFLRPEDILAHQDFIRQARLVCLHAHSLAPYFSGSRTVFVNHYNKYGVRCDERRSDRKTLLWIGAFQYVPYVLDGLRDVLWPYENITLLTNPDHAAARAAAERNAADLGIDNYGQRLSSTAVKLIQWTEASQRQALLTCAAAFDIKYLKCFNQFHKPPTKLQKYLASGIPCAINQNFSAARDLDGVATFAQLEQKWNDTEFLANLNRQSQHLSHDLSLASIANSYRELARLALEVGGAACVVGTC